MIAFDGLAGVLMLFLWVYCILDVIASESMLVRNLPKLVWLLIVVFLPDIGSIAWLLMGRPKGAGFAPGSTHPGPASTRMSRPAIPPGPLGPDDDPGFLRRTEERRLREWEEDLRRREERLRGDDEQN